MVFPYNNIDMKRINILILTILSTILLLPVMLLGLDNNPYQDPYNNIQVNDQEAKTGSVIGETEKLTIDQPTSSMMKPDSLVIERDVIPLSQFNPWEDYGQEELEQMMLAKGGNGSQLLTDYMTLMIETSRYWKGDPYAINFPTDNGVITYDSIKDVNEIFPNVKRIAYVMPEALFNSIFPNKLPDYTYELFLRSAQKFPRFCGEKSLSNPFTKDKSMEDVCRMELSMTFAHYHQETGGFMHIVESGAPMFITNSTGGSAYEWHQYRGIYCDPTNIWGKAYPCAPLVPGEGYPNYFGRGGKQLSWPYNYGPYSRVHYGIEDVRLLAEPWLLGSIDSRYPHDPDTLLESAIYFGMVPRGTKPSMHQIATGIWDPSSDELAYGHEYRFHATTNVINGGIECGSGNVNKPQAQARANYFIDMTTTFGIYNGWADQIVSPNEDCSSYTPHGNGTPNIKKGHAWVTNDWSTSIPTYEASSPFTIYFPGDYYRSKKSKEGDPSLDGGNWDTGLNPTYTKAGENYRQNVAYNQTTGWVSVESLSSNAPTSPVLENLTEVSHNHNSLEVELKYTQGTNSTNENGTIYLEKNGLGESSQPLIAGTNHYYFNNLDSNQEYKIYAEASNDDFGTITSSELLITTDPMPIVPTEPILEDLIEVEHTYNSIQVELKYAQGENSNNETGTIYIEQDGLVVSDKPLVEGVNLYDFIDLESNQEYKIYAQASNDDFGTITSSELLITTDLAPVIPPIVPPTVSVAKEVARTSTSIEVEVTYTQGTRTDKPAILYLNKTLEDEQQQVLSVGTNTYVFENLQPDQEYSFVSVVSWEDNNGETTIVTSEELNIFTSSKEANVMMIVIISIASLVLLVLITTASFFMIKKKK